MARQWGDVRIGAVDKRATRLRTGLETIEDGVRPAWLRNTDFGDTVLRFLERHAYSSSREIDKALCCPTITVLRVSHSIVFHFFAPTWIPHHLPEDQQTEKVELSQHMLEMIDGLAQSQLQYRIARDEAWIYWGNHCRGTELVERYKMYSNSKHILS